MIHQLKPKDILIDFFHFKDFKGEQLSIIEALLRKENVFALMATGMGKSLCFQIPCKIWGGLTLVLSPLIALMEDQVLKAQGYGFKVTTIHSNLNKYEKQKRYKALEEGFFELLYVTPERFQSLDFVSALKKNEIKLLAIDEAHSVSEWGFDFRPDYSRLGEIRNTLNFPTTLFLTATATEDVQREILESAKMENTLFFRGDLSRPQLCLNVETISGLESKLEVLKKYYESEKNKSCIIYFSLITTLKKVSDFFRIHKMPHLTYHGDLSASIKKKNLNSFLEEKPPWILATPAFGLGIDKQNVRNIIHMEIPSSLEAYYQEVGRSGRDGLNSQCLLLYDEDDISIAMEFIKWSHPEPDFMREVFKRIEEGFFSNLEELKEKMLYQYKKDFRLETTLNLLKSEGSIEYKDFPFTLKVLKKPEESFFNKEPYLKRLKKNNYRLLKMVEYAKTQLCRKNFIYQYFSIPYKKPCGVCDNCKKGSSSLNQLFLE